MTLDSISIGNRIEITLKRDEGLKTFASLVEKVDSDKKEVLAYMPISYGKLIKLPMTEKYVVVFFTEKGMFKFDCVVVEYLSEGEFHFMKLKIINDGLKVQRREYFRFNCLLPVKFEKIEKNE
ncbi:MAG: flagellar brake protein [Firmicutes bacterium]|nr:flagellar brake protein [Bacillota bacterium]